MSAPQPPSAYYPPPSAAVRAGSFVARVLWTVIPVVSVGLLGWVPAVHVARRRRTPASWWWLAGMVAGMVGECVLVYLVPGDKHGNAEAGAGAFALSYLITATVYAWRGCGPGPARRRPEAAPYPNPYPHPGYGSAAWPPAAFGSAPSTPYPAPVVPAVPAAAAHAMAAEIQADLRELRGFLGGEDAR
ncbi:hypothetical protein ABH935_005650 [Catenulispora sp. GAS73]|uniref:hypothetical protein n=1 Tax=Catenulispora sp. GAS73 TaxID=3156269 RepID=UPI00351881A0